MTKQNRKCWKRLETNWIRFGKYWTMVGKHWDFFVFFGKLTKIHENTITCKKI